MRRSVLVMAMLPLVPLPAQQQPPVRQLGPATAVSTERFGPALSVRALSNGSVLVNDVQNRRVVMLDSTLTQLTIVADSTSATANAYSGRSAGLIPYRGDSTLFVDPQSLTMLLIDPQGNVGRAMALPRSQDAMMLGSALGGATFDGQRLVYRAMPAFRMARPAGAAASGGGGMPAMPEMPDSTPIVRVDLATRMADTIGYIRIPRVRFSVERDDNGNVRASSMMNPLPTVDDFAVLSDGSVAFVRGHDYHIDWVRPDGTRESTAKIPFDWRRLSDEDKVAFMDSVKAQRERLLSQMEARDSARAGVEGRLQRMQAGPGGPGGPGRQGAGGAVRVTIAGPGAMDGGGGGMMMGGRNMQFVAPEELPDYQPVFFAGAARADQDGRLWIRTIPTRQVTGGPVYDVVDARGVLVDRVQVPQDRVIVGFGEGGVVFLATQGGESRTIERRRSR